MTRVILFSGGLDSTIAATLLPHHELLYVRLGHSYERDELNAARRIALSLNRPLRVARIKIGIGHLEQPDGHIPLRNTLLVQIAALEGADEIVLVSTLGETSVDKNKRWARHLSRFLTNQLRREIVVRLPFRGVSKKGLVSRYLKQGGDIGLLLETTSCYRPVRGVGCGRCLACFRRWVAMSLNGIEERYVEHPADFPVGDMHALLSYLVRSPLSDWAGVLYNNALAALALYRFRREK